MGTSLVDGSLSCGILSRDVEEACRRHLDKTASSTRSACPVHSYHSQKATRKGMHSVWERARGITFWKGISVL